MYTPVQLLASGARTASGTSIVRGNGIPFADRATLFLDVTAAAAAAGDTLDVYVQKCVSAEDAGSPTWQDMVHFTQVLGNGGAKQFVAHLLGTAVTTALGAPQDAAIAAGVANGPWGSMWRVKWVVAGATPSFTFSVYAHLSSDGD